MTEKADLPQVDKFDLDGIPSKKRLIIKQLLLLGPPFLPLVTIFIWSLATEQSGMSVLTLVCLLIGSMIGCVISSYLLTGIMGQYERLYKYIQRGIVTKVHEENTQLELDGYTGANIRVTQWVTVKPAVWRDARIGDVIDLA